MGLLSSQWACFSCGWWVAQAYVDIPHKDTVVWSSEISCDSQLDYKAEIAGIVIIVTGNVWVPRHHTKMFSLIFRLKIFNQSGIPSADLGVLSSTDFSKKLDLQMPSWTFDKLEFFSFWCLHLDGVEPLIKKAELSIPESNNTYDLMALGPRQVQMAKRMECPSNYY